MLYGAESENGSALFQFTGIIGDIDIKAIK